MTSIPQPAPTFRLNLGTHAGGLRQLLWLCAAGALGFLVPFLFADVLDVPRDAYYAIYCAAVFAFFLAWARASGLPLRPMTARNWKWALVLGLAGGALLAVIAVRLDSATPHPHGLTFAAAILWRGIVYGAADGLLLGAFPVLAVFAAFPFERGRAHLWRTVGTGALALLAALAITVVYHLGYRDFRSSKVTAPMRGSAIWTPPTLLTLNPVGAVLSHAGLHVAAVVHSYEGDTYLPPHAAAATPTITLSPCLIGAWRAECGTLGVAENPSEPDGAHIALKVAVVRAQSAHPKHDPLFWFAGWGSAGVTDDAANVISAFTDVNTDRDLVFVDQRGTGSSKLACRLPASRQPNAPLLGVTRAARDCAERIGPNLRYYTSAVAVDDFDQVRRALGYDTINIYGGSYGVTTGQIYLLRHGSHVRTAVFDSGSLLDVRIFEQQPRAKQRALELLFARCAADSACHAAYPNLRGEYRQILTRLAGGPIPIEGTGRTVDRAAFASVLDTMIAYTPGKAAVPRLIHLVATGQLARAAAAVPKNTQPTAQLAYQLLIQCNEPWASWRPAEIARLAPGTFLEPQFQLLANTMRAVCAGFPRADVPTSIRGRVHSSVPVLFLNGDEDGADPPASVANARRELPNSRTVVFPGAGHGQLSLTCAQSLIADLVRSGSASGLDASCARTAALQPFDTSGAS